MDKFKITPEIRKKIDKYMEEHKERFNEACKLYEKYIKCFSKAYISGCNLYVGERLYYNNESLYKNMDVINYFIKNKDEIKEFIDNNNLNILLGIDPRYN